jgi:hypothetical protein
LHTVFDVAAEPFIRRIELTAPTTRSVEARIEDFQHHFEVSLTHDGSVVTSIHGRAVRWPWSTCVEAAHQLEELVGAPVGQLPRVQDPGMHCTHQLDLALSAVRFAGSGRTSRSFDVMVTDWGTAAGRAVLERDDGLRLDWTLDGFTITAPELFAGQQIGAGFARWAHEALDADSGEAALILRRAVRVAPMRTLDLDTMSVAAESGLTEGVCYTAQPERLHIATRKRGMAKVVRPPS